MKSVTIWIVSVCGIMFLQKMSTLPVEEASRRLNRIESHPFRGKLLELFSEKGLSSFVQFLNAMEQTIYNQISNGDQASFINYGETMDQLVPLPYLDFAFTCPTCRMMLGLLETYLKIGKPVEEIEETCVNLCVTFKITSEHVCRGAIHAFVDEVVLIVKMSGITAKDICGFVVGLDCEPPGFEGRFNWSVAPHPTKKPPVVNLKPPQNGFPTKRVLHLSDTHLDPYYQEGANAGCDLPLCCRDSVGPPDKPSNRAGKWGDHRKCDSPLRTIDHMMNHIAKTEKIDYIIWTGDLPPHDVYNQTKAGNLKHNHYVYNLFSTYFPKTPIFPALGNHETDPINSFPQPDITDPERSIHWLYNELSKSWPKLMLKDSNFNTETLMKGGYYSVLVEPGFRIISLNMNYGNNLNFWLFRDSNDPADELAWLTSELGKAEAKGEKVHLLGHIPPGNEDCLRIWSRNFHQIVNRFENTVTAQFYGHSHFDEIIVFHDEDLKRATNIAYIGPSTTTFTYLNPAYKIYTVDGDYSSSTRMVIDGEGYYLDITEANLHDKPEWKKLFTMKDAYGMESLTPADWSEFVKRMSTDDALFQKFFKHFHRDSESYPPCDGACIQQLICKQVTATSFDRSVCKEMGIIPSKR